MMTNITARHMDLTEALKNYAEKKAQRLLNKYSRISEIEIVFNNEGSQQKVEIIVKIDNHQPFVVNHGEEDAYASLDIAVDKIDRQLGKHKDKRRSHKGRTGAAEATAEVIRSVEEKEEES